MTVRDGSDEVSCNGPTFAARPVLHAAVRQVFALCPHAELAPEGTDRRMPGPRRLAQEEGLCRRHGASRAPCVRQCREGHRGGSRIRFRPCAPPPIPGPRYRTKLSISAERSRRRQGKRGTTTPDQVRAAERWIMRARATCAGAPNGAMARGDRRAPQSWPPAASLAMTVEAWQRMHRRPGRSGPGLSVPRAEWPRLVRGDLQRHTDHFRRPLGPQRDGGRCEGRAGYQFAG